MRKLSIFAILATIITACTTAEFDEVKFVSIADAPKSITLAIEDDATRVELSDGRTTVWSTGDCVSVFAKSDANAKYEYRGETGSTTATFHLVSSGSGSKTMADSYILYPYNEQSSVDVANGTIVTTIPNKQKYHKNSYGIGSSVMVGSGEQDKVMLKSVCGWIKIQLTGSGEVVERIVLKGNKGEALAGGIVVNPKSATLGNGKDLTSSYSVTLNCDGGVKLSSTPASFFIAVAPQTFEEGITVEISCADGSSMSQITYNKVDVKRNYIQPMAAFEYAKGSPVNNEIWYITSDGELLDVDSDDFDANIISHTIEEICVNMMCRSMGVIKFDKDVTEIKTQAFRGCQNLQLVNLPNSILTIRSMAFYECLILKTVTLGNSIQTIEQGAFGYCSNLASITLPESVISIGAYSFAYCNNLSSAYIKATTPPTLGMDAFYCYKGSSYTPIGTKLYVPVESIDEYKAAKKWSTYEKYMRRYDYDNDAMIDIDTDEGGEEDDIQGPKFHHRVLLVDHTGTGCGNCPRVMDGLELLAQTDCREHYHEVTCHGGGYAYNDNAYSTAAYYVNEFYNPSGYPDVRFNFHGQEGSISAGSTFVSTNSTIINAYTKNNSAAAGIAAQVKAGSSSVKVDISVMAAIEQEYKVTAWLLENDVYNPNQSGATNSTYHIYHDHCLRNIGGAYSKNDIYGDSLGVIEVGKSKDYSFDIPISSSSWNVDNMEVLIIVSAPLTATKYEVVNTALCPINGSIDFQYAE